MAGISYLTIPLLLCIHLCRGLNSRHIPNRGKQCDTIESPLCRHYLSYNRTLLPNIFGHRDQTDINSELYQLFPAIRTKCHARIGELLCSMYFPKCTTDDEKIVLPCRRLCSAIKSECGDELEAFGFRWPQVLNCDRLPQECEEKHTDIDFSSSCETLESLDSQKMCKNILPYKLVQLPNILWHQSSSDVSGQLSGYKPIFDIDCNPYLKEFLCSFHLPECRNDNRLVLPCQSLCLLAMIGCRDQMEQIGFIWPQNLDCQKLPESGHCYDGSRITRKSRNERKFLPPPTEDRYVEKIVPTRVCTHNMTYNYTRFPNLLGHSNQDDIAVEINQFFPLVEVNCSPHLRAFICSVFFPPATDAVKGLIWPCRNLCESARLGCEPLMIDYGFHWPTRFMCARFPISGVCFDGESIIGQENDADTDTDTDSVDSIPNPPLVCEAVSAGVCDTLPYKTTRLPNALGHRTQTYINNEMDQYMPLIQAKCSDHLQDFLCSLHLPECRNDTGIVLPCRPLCQMALEGCRSLTGKLGFIWPEDLDCDKLPESGNCYAGLQSRHSQKATSEVSSSSAQTSTSDSDKSTHCTVGDYNCRDASSRIYIDSQMTCCFDERLLYYKSGRDPSSASSCQCVYPSPKEAHGSC